MCHSRFEASFGTSIRLSQTYQHFGMSKENYRFYGLKNYAILLISVQVVRCFEDNDIVHMSGKVDPKSDIDLINLELFFSDFD